MVRVSIIIVSWNAKDFLLGCLQSLITEMSNYQTEIIVVDNASTDGSKKAVRQQFPFVKLICNETNIGFAKANNIGIMLSSGKYVCLINSDVTVKSGCIDLMCAYMDKHSTVGILGPRILNEDLSLQPSCMEFPALGKSFYKALGFHRISPRSIYFPGNSADGLRQDTPSSVDVLSGCFWMVRREALKQVGLLDENFFMYLEDVDWCKRFHEAGWKVVYFPHAEAIHYGGGSSSNSPVRFFRELLRSRLLYWRKHHGRARQMAILLISLLNLTVRIFSGITLYVFKASERITILSYLKRNVVGFLFLIGYLVGLHKERRNTIA